VAADFEKLMPAYAVQQAASRLDRLGYELGRTNKSTDADAVHDLRVSIRRFVSCLRLFRQYFPRKDAKKARKRLREILQLAAAVRDRDIAVELGRQAGLAAESPLLEAWLKQRDQAARKLAAAVKRAVKNDLSNKWRGRLSLDHR
jgi:CHAD domain-containing protein